MLTEQLTADADRSADNECPNIFHMFPLMDLFEQRAAILCKM